MMAADSQWALVDAPGLRVARFEDRVLAFNPVSWQTHYLVEPAGSVLEALISGPKTTASLCELLIDPEIPEPEAMSLVENALHALLSLGLLEPHGTDDDHHSRAPGSRPA